MPLYGKQGKGRRKRKREPVKKVKKLKKNPENIQRVGAGRKELGNYYSVLHYCTTLNTPTTPTARRGDEQLYKEDVLVSALMAHHGRQRKNQHPSIECSPARGPGTGSGGCPAYYDDGCDWGSFRVYIDTGDF
uniref:Uncharacterized protein n=1 Tax=Oryza brachyantha TaxID=4533 RepID=J3KYY8_ORYBR